VSKVTLIVIYPWVGFLCREILRTANYAVEILVESIETITTF